VGGRGELFPVLQKVGFEFLQKFIKIRIGKINFDIML